MRNRILILLLTTLLSSTAAIGQATSTVKVSGTVSDPAGAVVPKANITITEVETAIAFQAVSKDDGSFLFPNLPVGEYRLEVAAPGFKNYIQKGIILEVNTNPTIAVQLQVGSTSQQIVVQADTARVETHDTAVSQVINNQQIVEFPLNGRQATQLIVLSGGATATNSNPVNDLAGNSKQYPNSVDISVAGGQANGTNYLLDGADHNDAFSNVNLPFPFPDALNEFSVQTSVLSAQYGLHPGAVVNAVTNSGTNVFHGGVFEFLRNGDLDAKNYFATTRDTLKQNQFGGVVGGPLKKNRLFFFTGYQGTRIRTAPATVLSYVPTQAVLSGDFRALESAPCQSNNQARAIIDPTTGQPFPDSYVSPSRFNTPAMNLLKTLPVSSDPCGSIHYGVPSPQDEDQGIARVDWTINQKESIFARYFISDFRNPTFFNKSNALATAAYGLFDRAQSLVVGNTYVFNPQTIMIVHAGFTRLAIVRASVPGIPNAAGLGVQIANPLPNALSLSLTGRFSISRSDGYFNTNAFQVADDLEVIRGKHEFGLGVDLLRNQMNELGSFTANGQFAFNGSFTKDALLDFMLGLPSSFIQSGLEHENWRQTYLGVYVDDNYKIRKGVTLTYGLRWEPYLPTADVYHRGNHFDPQSFAAGVSSVVYPNAPYGLFFCGDKQMPCSYVNHRLGDIAPRVGAIIDPRGQGKETIRLSYGIFFDEPEIFYFDRFADSFPWAGTISIASPAGGFTNPYASYPGGSPFPVPFPPPHNVSFASYGAYINLPLESKPTYMQQWNLTLQKQFLTNWVVSAAYLGNRTLHIWSGNEENPAVYIPGTCGKTACSTTGNTNQRRKLYLANPTAGSAFSTLGVLDDGADASYSGLLLTADHKFDTHFSMLANYTWSHCISRADFYGELTGPQYQDPSNPAKDRSNCGFDIRQIFNLSMIAKTPEIHERALSRAVGVWEIGGVLNRNTGLWFSPLTGTDNSLTGVGRDRPNVTGNPNLTNPTIKKWFNVGAYTANAAGTFGNAGRNSLVGPSAVTLSMSLTRYFQITEDHRLQLRGDFFNALNHANFNDPVNTLNSSTFGQVTTAADPRIIQVALKYSF